ncbi:uncharacterized protein LOC111712676 isoform X2 [Eurytemora carolleeae]|uniref:uncharacterized protein LOC111712676 isoform X1 n=1 Tax=Eurytemora carolleeae TaxID=1294199 RepID=UPI000C75BB01|nr:uncharacterized protein LOC111712676 isoform X1 [Eurytemora carolleeae]XP_023343127.1 uncharacterized protein LOC111712676 isoform X2 [Eurytemora carolleeae]|eukprot:XP_023343126.1 uncharacterized protein LOC111712676 isoform X1 [Eurytemora affinis]
MEQIREMENMLENAEHRISRFVEKPSTRVQACQLLANAKALQTEIAGFQIPDLEAEYSESEGDRLDAALDRYNNVRQQLADVQAKAETLCVCWDKLDQDVTELTKLLSSGGGSRMTIEKLEQSITQLRDMFTVRRNIIEDLPSSLAPGALEM